MELKPTMQLRLLERVTPVPGAPVPLKSARVLQQWFEGPTGGEWRDVPVEEAHAL